MSPTAADFATDNAVGADGRVDAVSRTFLARGADPERLHSDSFDYAHETGHDA